MQIIYIIIEEFEKSKFIIIEEFEKSKLQYQAIIINFV